jgi:hypothetical protein
MRKGLFNDREREGRSEKQQAKNVKKEKVG